MRRLLAAALLCSVLAFVPTSADAACPDCGIAWQAAQPIWNAQQFDHRYPRQVRKAIPVRTVQRKQTIQARLSPPIAKTPVAKIVKVITAPIAAIVTTGSAIAAAMRPDHGKNLHSAYRGLAYCGLYLGDVAKRLGFKIPRNNGAWAPDWRFVGTASPVPCVDCVMVTMQHVGVIDKVFPNGTVSLCGGNQAGGRVNCLTVPARGWYRRLERA